MTGPPIAFRLADAIDVGSARRQFMASRRVQLDPFLAAEPAAELAAHLSAREDWRLVVNAGDRVYEIDRDGQAAMSAAQRAELDVRLAAAARAGFQFRFESIRTPDDGAGRKERGTPLDEFAVFMSSPAVLELLRAITGADKVTFADAQATRYGPGDFLTEHDDAVDGKNRHAAYVLGLTEGWRAAWGGLLAFHDADDHLSAAWVPRFNCLSLFAVPQAHSVTLVAPFAGHARLSVTGWLRSGDPGA